MKASKILVVFVLGLLASSLTVLAQEELPPAGITPDSWLYGLEKAWERIRMFFTFDSEGKAKLHLQFASERLAEANEMVGKGKPEFVQDLLKEHETEINETEKEVEGLRALGRNITLLAEHVCNMTYKHIDVLERVLANVSEQAKPAIERAINASIKGHENCAEKIKERIGQIISEIRTTSCEENADCAHLVCPMVLGYDTPLCHEGKCKCGAKWEIVNATEWRERFNETLTQEVQKRIEETKRIYNQTRIEEIVTEAVIPIPE